MYREKLPCPGRGLPLIQEKKQKKIKASPRPGNLAGYMISLKNVPGKTSLPRQGPCLDTRKEAKENQGLTEAGEFGRVHVGMEKGPGNLAGYVWGWKMGCFFLRSAGR